METDYTIRFMIASIILFAGYFPLLRWIFILYSKNDYLKKRFLELQRNHDALLFYNKLVKTATPKNDTGQELTNKNITT